MSRTVIVGDVHGCADELTRLLDSVHFRQGDALFFTGDLLSRGPDPAGVLAIVRRTGARSVRGNHEEALLRWRRTQPGRDPSRGRAHRSLAERLTDRDWDLLDALPLWLDLPEHEVRLVHGGVIPGVPIEQQPREALLSMRYLGPNGEPIEKGGTVLWGTRYQGPPHVVFGHNAQPEPQLHPWATGLDTAAVYGRRLTAMVLEAGAKVPPVAARADVLVSVFSSGAYHE
jgi:hypothetical protein